MGERDVRLVDGGEGCEASGWGEREREASGWGKRNVRLWVGGEECEASGWGEREREASGWGKRNVRLVSGRNFFVSRGSFALSFMINFGSDYIEIQLSRLSSCMFVCVCVF